MTTRQLAAAALVLVIALTPSVADVAQAHAERPQHLPLIYGWLLLAVIVACLAGEQLLGS